MKCMDPVGVYKPGHNDTCKIVTDFKTTKVKAKYTCKVGICTYVLQLLGLLNPHDGQQGTLGQDQEHHEDQGVEHELHCSKAECWRS